MAAAKFAQGKPVKVTRGGVALGVGRYVKKEPFRAGNGGGEWHIVNMAEPKKTPILKKFRESNLARV
jgi:hypothetical protein